MHTLKVSRPVALIYAHPYPDRSCANRTLFEAVRNLPYVNVRSLYELYPDFYIDVRAEREALQQAELIVWQHPMYWYSAPAMLALWFEKVLARGFAYGDGGTALHSKRCLWVVTTGGDQSAFSESGMHGHHFQQFVPAIKQTARFCGMSWEEPIVVNGAELISDAHLRMIGEQYRGRLAEFAALPEET